VCSNKDDKLLQEIQKQRKLHEIELQQLMHIDQMDVSGGNAQTGLGKHGDFRLLICALFF